MCVTIANNRCLESPDQTGTDRIGCRYQIRHNFSWMLRLFFSNNLVSLQPVKQSSILSNYLGNRNCSSQFIVTVINLAAS